MPVLQFKGKTAIECYHHTVPHHTLEFDPKLSVLGKGEKPGLDGNLIIEGDNLIALKALLPTHAGRIKCIYVDPPYNTGNEGWVYNDNLSQPQFKEWIGQTVGKESEDATRHDKWCCMMYPRLQLLKQLLHDNGVIFISIDDNEVAQLKMLCDEVFGPENLVAQIPVRSNPRGRQSDTHIATVHDYCLCYGKDDRTVDLNGLPLSKEHAAEFDNVDEHGEPWRELGLRQRGAGSLRSDRPDMFFPIFVDPRTGSIALSRSKSSSIEVLPRKADGRDGRWMWSPEKVEKEKDRVYARLVARRNEFDIFIKDYLRKDDVERTTKPKSLWDDAEVNNELGKETLRRILGEDTFPHPKTIGLIKRILRIATDHDDLILDSFAGSGTTGHAALELNKEDGGNRRLILVQQPYDTKDQEKEKFNICQKITAERVRRVIQGYTYSNQKGKKEKVAGLGGSFIYARVGNPLFGEYRDWGKQLPAYEELAKYIFYTETSRDFDRKVMNERIGKIGEHHGTSYYLLYTPDGQEDRRLDMEWLKSLDKTEKNRNLVVYCEKIWVHRDDLAKFEQETKRTVRPMIVPFNLK